MFEVLRMQFFPGSRGDRGRRGDGRWPFRMAFLCLVTLGIAALPPLQLPCAASLSEVLVEAAEPVAVKGMRVSEVDRGHSEKVAWIRIRVLSDTPPGETWDVIRDVPHWNRFTDLFTEVTSLPPEGPMQLYRMYVSPPWPISGAETFVRVIQKPADRLLDYWVDAGMMAGTYGRIAVSEAPGGGSRILFENLGSPAQRFPDWMVKISVYLLVPRVLKGLRQQILLRVEEASRVDESLFP